MKSAKTVTKTKTPKPPTDGEPSATASVRFQRLVADARGASKKKPKAADSPATAAAESGSTDDPPPAAPAAPPAPEAAASTPPPTEGTLRAIGDGWLKALEAAGKSRSTVASYANDLNVAYGFLGADTPVESLTPARIAAFDRSDAVTKKKGGAGRALPTILKTRRVLRLAVAWALAAGMIATSPYPKAEPDAA